MRDRSQALAVVSLVLQHLPQYAFKPEELRMFPRDVIRRTREVLDSRGNLSGF